MSAARSAASPESRTLERDGCEIAWELRAAEGTQAAAGEPVALLHGFGMSRAAMMPLATELLERGAASHAVLADARGHGRTRAPAIDDAYSYPAMRDDCIALIAQAAPSGAHLVGHSMGGQVALLVAIARPDLTRSLTLIAAGPCRAVTHEKERRSWTRAAAAFEAASSTELARSLAAAAPTRDERLLPDRLYGASRGADLARVVRGGFLTVETNDDACSALTLPTLLIAGSLDEAWLEPTRKLTRAVRDAELLELTGAGHLAHLERGDVCADAIAAFLERIR